MTDEVTLLYDITPQWVDEREFEEVHRQLDDLLPPGASLFERFVQRKQPIEITYAQAEPLYKRALTIFEKALGPHHPEVATALENYAKLLRATDRQIEATEMEARAIQAKRVN